ncbi:hypothetical protein ACGH2B_12830 [Streptomyces sp. BBFR2]|uniref:hypothetical protein n=1 Tax=Streptomyces sp. BBFR2 TaxID=3372854 RepID=UPI0037DA546E
MPSFQTGYVPHGFTADENGARIHYKDAVLIPVPPPNGGYGWKGLWFSLGSDFADVRIRVALHNGTTWSTSIYDVPSGGGRVGFSLANGTTKISLGRAKKSATDTVDNAPVGWLLESQA